MPKTALSLLRTTLLAAALSLAAVAAFAQAPARRVALVVGNGAYQANPLKNPPNDAEDVAAALKESGFEVYLVKDAALDVLEKAVNDFSAKLKGADTGLFYFAGHGVAVEGMNYLIPVSPRIDDAASVRSKAVAVDAVVGKMEATGVRTVLVFLDSCRDNPFPGASRSGTRGLAVVATPKTLNSLIVYATSPGDVAQDGEGRNGVFSGALIKQLKEPGLELTAMMRNVKAEVAAVTANKQNPRVDDGMKEPFFFVDPAQAAARAQAALDRSRTELAGLDTKLAELQRQIAASNDAQARQKLQVEEQRQQALQQAKALESENLAREAAKQKAAAESAAALAAERAAAQAASAKIRNDLSNLAATRRAELEKLAQAAARDNPDVLIETVERLEAVLKEVDGQYAAALQKSLDACNAGWDRQLASLSGQQPDITETDPEFNARIAKEKADLQGRRQGELAALRSDAESQRVGQTAAIRKQYDGTLATLQTKVWALRGSAVKLAIGTFDRNARTWPFTVSSADPAVPMFPVAVVAELGAAADPAAAIRGVDAAVKASALAAEVDWGITRDAARARYGVDIRAVRVMNLTTDEAVVEASPAQRAAYFAAGKRAKPTQAAGSLAVSAGAKDGAGEVFIDGKKAGTTPLTLKLPEGTHGLEVRWADRNAKVFSVQARVDAGKTTAISASKPAWKVGDTGPAGGLIFHDKGSASDGWRYLEAAPSDQSAGIQWHNGNDLDIKTGTAVGTGRANTQAIIAAQGAGNYAATLCKNLSINGFSDWFLPSRDELDAMYVNLHKAGRGVFGSAWYWSSSRNDYGYDVAWEQDFSDGGQGNYGNYLMGSDSRVRAVRAF
ncbi:MAG: caspase family protein [Spirochaetes bacterium]|nr:caspase family protein [Spirochaetota bacterium]